MTIVPAKILNHTFKYHSSYIIDFPNLLATLFFLLATLNCLINCLIATLNQNVLEAFLLLDLFIHFCPFLAFSVLYHLAIVQVSFRHSYLSLRKKKLLVNISQVLSVFLISLSLVSFQICLLCQLSSHSHHKSSYFFFLSLAINFKIPLPWTRQIIPQLLFSSSKLSWFIVCG